MLLVIRDLSIKVVSKVGCQCLCRWVCENINYEYRQSDHSHNEKQTGEGAFDAQIGKIGKGEKSGTTNAQQHQAKI